MAMAGRLVEVSRMGTLERSYKYRLYPTSEQAQRLEAWQQACWEVQRWCIKQRRWAEHAQRALRRADWPQYDNDGMPLVAFPDPGVCPEHLYDYQRYPNKYTQRYEVSARRPHNEAWDDVPAHTMYDIIYRVEKAWGDAIEENKRRKSDEKEAKARWADEPTDVGLPFTRGILGGITVEGRYASVMLGNATKLGAFRLRYHRPVPDGATVQQAYVTRDVDGWYISLSCKIPLPEPLPATGHALGVDLNCIHQGDNQDIAALSDGRIYSVPDNLKKSAQKLAHLQKMVSNRRTQGTAKCADPTSARTKKRRQQIAKLHQRIARQREHQLHYVARRVVDTADEVKFEDVNWSNLRRQGTPREHGDNRRGGRKANKGRNRSMSSASPGKLRELTEQKAKAGGRVCGVVSARNTSKACSACGAVLAEMTAAVRQWTCPECGAEHNRDVNAAKNVLARDYKERKKRAMTSGYKPRRNGRNHSNPSASGDMPGEGLPECGSVNSEPTARQSTAAPVAENAPTPAENSASGEAWGEIPGVARTDGNGQSRRTRRKRRRRDGAMQLSLDL
jgi:putative transposase